MTLWRLVHRSLRQHALSTVVTAGSLMLATGLLLTVWILRNQAAQAFTDADAGFDGVLGARGSKLQLVLNAVFHLESSPGNLRWDDYVQLTNQPGVALAVPLAVGDNYRGFRLVGTLPSLFEISDEMGVARLTVQPGGRHFDPERREAVVGSFAARRLGLKVGDTFQPYHGLVFDPKARHAETFVVVGLLEPSNTPADRVLWIPLAGLQNLTGHDPAAAQDISAVLVRLDDGSPGAGFLLDLLYNRQGNRLTFAWPIAQVVTELFDRLGWLERVLTLVAWLVAVVAAASVLTGLYNSMNERRRDLAVLRALGAHRRTVLAAVVLEAGTIAALGAGAGLLAHLALMTLAAMIIQSQTGVVLDPWTLDPVLFWGPALIVLLGALAGLAPAWKAYRTDVAEALGHTA
ncbi:MAG: ABC transporter permease [Verrucomicrobiales bacterium]|nr:ABC transporter permease [Verrucomicrobiales bacterium]